MIEGHTMTNCIIILTAEVHNRINRGNSSMRFDSYFFSQKIIASTQL